MIIMTINIKNNRKYNRVSVRTNMVPLFFIFKETDNTIYKVFGERKEEKERITAQSSKFLH
jgi:hypothetical protein